MPRKKVAGFTASSFILGAAVLLGSVSVAAAQPLSKKVADPSLKRSTAQAAPSHVLEPSRPVLMANLVERLHTETKSPGYSLASKAMQELLKGGSQAAIRYADQALSRDKQLAAAYAIKGIAYAEFEQAQDSRDCLDKAIALDPAMNDTYILDLRRRANSDLGNWAAAMADTQTVIARHPKESWRYRERGEIYLAQKKNELALADFTTSIKMEPNNYNSYKQRGDLLSHLGRYKDALADYNNSLRLCPGEAILYGCRADCYEKLGQAELAKKDRAMCNSKGFNSMEAEGLGEILGK
jgi:tetratricopeptide (TPR) repeat protein